MPKLDSHPRVIANAIALDGRRTKYAIIGAAGLILECSPDGGRAWYARYQVGHGRKGRTERYHRLGSFDDKQADHLTFKQAKDRAEGLRTDAKRDGIDPFAKDRGINVGATLDSVFADWLETYSKVNKKSWKFDEDLYARHVKKRLGSKVASEIKRIDASQALDEVATKAPRQADLMKAMLSTVYNWGINTGRVETNPFFQQPSRHRGEARDRVLTDEELTRIWQALDNRPRGQQMPRAIKLLILTGARVNEVIGAEISELRDDVWIKPAVRMKNDDPHAVPLCRMSLALFRAAAAEPATAGNGQRTGRIFEGRFGSGRETFDPKACSRAVTRLMQELEIDASAHDFRRTIATRLSEVGVPDDIIERLLSHRGGRSTVTGRHYNHNDKLPEKRRALRIWELRVRALSTGRKPRALSWVAPARRHSTKIAMTSNDS